MKNLKFVIYLFVIMGINRCTIKVPNESDMPNWDLELNFPMGSEIFYAEDILEDSTIATYVDGDGDSIIAFENNDLEIERTVVGDKLVIEDISQSFTQEVTDVNIDDLAENVTMDMEKVAIDNFSSTWTSEVGAASVGNSDPVASNSVELSEIYDFSLIPEDQTVIVPQNTLLPSQYEVLNFDEYDEIVIKSGYMDVVVYNNLAVEMGSPITITFLYPDSTPILNDDGVGLTMTSDILVAAGETSPVVSIPLDNHSLTDEIIAKIDGYICGSGPATITNNSDTRNSSFYVDVSTRDILVHSAVAVIPEQNFGTASAIAIPESEHEIVSATIKTGNMNFSLDNSLNLDLVVDLAIPGLTLNGTAFETSFSVDAASQKMEQFSLNGYKISPENDSLYVMPTIRTISTDPEKVYIEETHGLDLVVDFYGVSEQDSIEFSGFEGIVNTDNILNEGQITINSNTQITNAVFSEGLIDIKINNNVIQSIEQPLQLMLEIPEIFDDSNNPLAIGPIDISPGETQVPINATNSLANYKLVPKTNIDDTQYISYSAEIIMPQNASGIYDLDENFVTDILISEMSFSSVTGYFNRDAIVEIDSIAFPGNHQLDAADFSGGLLTISVENNIGINADVSIAINEIVSKTDGQALEIPFELTGSNGDDYKEIVLSDYLFTNQKDRNFITYTSTITIPSDEEMTLYAGENFLADIVIQDIMLNSISGILDTIEVVIDSDEEEIDDFSEELKNVNLEETDIEIIFDTNIGANFELDIELTTSNEDGETETVAINHLVLKDDESSKTLIIDDANRLLNIAPNRLLFSGSARLYGEANVTSEQYVAGTALVLVPFTITIDDNTKIEMDIEKVEEDIPDELNSLSINADIENEFDLSGVVRVLASKDSLDLVGDTYPAADTLAVFNISGNDSYQQQIEIGMDEIDLLRDECYVLSEVELDATDEGEQIKVLTSDQLKITLYGTVNLNIDLTEDDEE